MKRSFFNKKKINLKNCQSWRVSVDVDTALDREIGCSWVLTNLLILHGCDSPHLWLAEGLHSRAGLYQMLYRDKGKSFIRAKFHILPPLAQRSRGSHINVIQRLNHLRQQQPALSSHSFRADWRHWDSSHAGAACEEGGQSLFFLPTREL